MKKKKQVFDLTTGGTIHIAPAKGEIRPKKDKRSLLKWVSLL